MGIIPALHEIAALRSQCHKEFRAKRNILVVGDKSGTFLIFSQLKITRKEDG